MSFKTVTKYESYSMKIPRKAVVSHAGSRDFYQLSIALEKAGLLECLVTDLFLPPFLGKKVSRKYTEELPYSKVSNIYSNLFRNKILKQPYYITDQILTKTALSKALYHDSNLFLYSYTALEAFEHVKQRCLPNKCFLFQLHHAL